MARRAAADEGGVSFWLPGQYGSFAAAPGEPGWSLPMIWYHSATDAQAGKSFEIGGRITAGLDVRADMLFIAPTYVFATPVAGGQASVGFTGLVGQVRVSTSATLSGPNGNTITSGQSDTQNGVGDLYPSASLRWNSGAHNFMVYTMGGVPVGSYSVEHLANLGSNHWAIDAVADTPISISPRSMNSQPYSASRTTAKTTTRITRTARVRTWTGPHRNSFPSS